MPYFQIKDPDGKSLDNVLLNNLPIEIGRAEGSGLLLDDESVSRKHARITQKNGRIRIEDVESLNGVWFNGNRLEAPCELNNRDRVMLGDFELIFVK